MAKSGSRYSDKRVLVGGRSTLRKRSGKKYTHRILSVSKQTGLSAEKVESLLFKTLGISPKKSVGFRADFQATTL